MDAARPLREVFADLTGNASGDPGGLLRDLPAELVAEAVVSYADTALAEVAEHLAPFVSAHSVVGPHDAAGAEPDWRELLATVPAAAEPDLDDLPPEADDDLGFGTGAIDAEFEDVAIDEVVGDGIDAIGDGIDAVGDGLLDFPADPITLDTLDDLCGDTVDWPETGDADDAGPLD